ncbi:IS21 family transposase [Pedobacter paludis]|uniref:IS21 family transposase n=1 Tax=Pedobacter paludis TaxID=2203212 RepID=A0A317F288_9SPHI|nr:IS21 family transposase [Pedobacter paludis]PWS33301.1 IS21 family transposase [Pedobacter paludis]
MANITISMNKIRQILRMYDQGVGRQKIADYVGTSRTTVNKYISAFDNCGFPIKDVDGLEDNELNELFSDIYMTPRRNKPRMDELLRCFPLMEKALKRTGVTRQHLWREYKREFPSGYHYTQFCAYFKHWQQRLNPTMHRIHKVGDKLFVDFAGKKLSYVDKETGEIVEVEVFVAILGASQLTYIEAVASQQKEDFIKACENALYYIGGVPSAIVPDNLKAAVIKSHRFEPTLNQTFESFANHYNTCVLPARAYKPRDKALVEGAVKIMYTRIYLPVRQKTYYSLAELNAAIWENLERHNNQQLQGRSYSRRTQFEEIERKALLDLPITRFEMQEQCWSRVKSDSHVFLGPDKHYYSVPIRYLNTKVKILYSASTVEIFNKTERIALHPRDRAKHAYTTNSSHLSHRHRYSVERTTTSYLQRAAEMHNDIRMVIEAIVTQNDRHEDQIIRSCEGVFSLAKKYGEDRLAGACRRAMDFGVHTKFKSIQSILEKNLDSHRENLFAHERSMPQHDNIRGEKYYK